EADRDLALHVGTAACRAGPATRPLVEQSPEDVADASAGAAPGEQVTEVERERAAARPPAGGAHTATEQCARLVVLLALLRVGQDGVGLGHVFEPSLGLLVALVVVGVELASQRAVGLLDRRRIDILGDAEDLVIVLLDPVLRAHAPPPFLTQLS